jgi:hypothetical protein
MTATATPDGRSDADMRHVSFLNLPTELRDTVYDELFQGLSLTCFDPNIRPDLGITFHFFYKFNGTRKHRNVPRWLFTCKQIFNEALEQWYRGASCSPCFCRPESGISAAGSYGQAFCELVRVQSFDGPVLSTAYASDEDYVLWPSQSTTASQRSSSLVPRISEHSVSYAISDCFYKYLENNTNHPAKRIKLSLTTTPWDDMRAIDSVNLSSFQSLGSRFDRVVFRIACPTFSDRVIDAPPTSWPSLKNALSMYTKIQYEAVRVATYLVSGNISMGWEIRDYLLPIRTLSDDVIPNAYEWHVEVIRRQKQQKGHLQYIGILHWRKEKYRRRGRRQQYDYFRSP